MVSRNFCKLKLFVVLVVMRSRFILLQQFRRLISLSIDSVLGSGIIFLVVGAVGVCCFVFGFCLLALPLVVTVAQFVGSGFHRYVDLNCYSVMSHGS